MMVKKIPILILFGCGVALNGYGQSRHLMPRNPDRLCDRLAEIRSLPQKGDPGVDAAYDSLMAAGQLAVPCLINKITDTTPMSDPRCPRFSYSTTVGDVAFFVFTDITRLSFVELLPPSMQKRYQTEGAYVFDDYINRKGARRQLQSKVRAWYDRKRELK